MIPPKGRLTRSTHPPGQASHTVRPGTGRLESVYKTIGRGVSLARGPPLVSAAVDEWVCETMPVFPILSYMKALIIPSTPPRKSAVWLEFMA